MTVILADGSFPEHEIPLGYLRNCERIICCDGSVNKLIEFGLEPHAIIGDLDSIGKEIEERYSDRLYKDREQETNDLTKAVKWCLNRNYKDIVILGATGKREDHTVGNISLLAEYVRDVRAIMVTDTGIILPLLESSKIDSFPGQQVSVFSIDPDTEISSSGLRYTLRRTKLNNWWRATLNEATGSHFKLRFKGGPLLVFLKFRE